MSIDPFHVLRRLDAFEDPALTDVAQDFRAALVADARQRLERGSGVEGVRRIPPAIGVANRPAGGNEPPNRRHRIVLAAACVILITAALVAISTYDRPDDDDPIASVPVASTTPIATTTVPPRPPLTDQQLVDAIRLQQSELGLPFGEVYAPDDQEIPDLFTLERYAGEPECSAFDGVLRPLADSVYGYRAFGHPPAQPADQMIAVLGDDATASSVLATFTSSAFQPCIESYAAGFVFRFGSETEPPFSVTADEYAYYTYEQPSGQINAGVVARVGRTLQFVESSITWYEPPRELITEEQFGVMVEAAVARARAALAGAPISAEG